MIKRIFKPTIPLVVGYIYLLEPGYPSRQWVIITKVDRKYVHFRGIFENQADFTERVPDFHRNIQEWLPGIPDVWPPGTGGPTDPPPPPPPPPPPDPEFPDDTAPDIDGWVDVTNGLWTRTDDNTAVTMPWENTDPALLRPGVKNLYTAPAGFRIKAVRATAAGRTPDATISGDHLQIEVNGVTLMSERLAGGDASTVLELPATALVPVLSAELAIRVSTEAPTPIWDIKFFASNVDFQIEEIPDAPPPPPPPPATFTGWSVMGTVPPVNNTSKITFSGASNVSAAFNTFSLVDFGVYNVSFTMDNYVQGAARLMLYGPTIGHLGATPSFSGNGVHTFTVTLSASGTLADEVRIQATGPSAGGGNTFEITDVQWTLVGVDTPPPPPPPPDPADVFYILDEVNNRLMDESDALILDDSTVQPGPPPWDPDDIPDQE